MKHLYIAVGCKTMGCNTAHVLMQLGEKGKAPAKVESWMSYPLMLDCPTCGKTYDYSDSEDKVFQKELPAPPPRSLYRLAESPFQDTHSAA